MLAIVRKSKADDRRFMGIQAADFFPGLEVPQADGEVLVGGEGMATIIGDGRAIELSPFLSTDDADLLVLVLLPLGPLPGTGECPQQPCQQDRGGQQSSQETG